MQKPRLPRAPLSVNDSAPTTESPSRGILTFAPFVADRSDPLFVFSDATVHSACFTRHPLSEQAKKWHDEAARHKQANERVCAACSELILDPDDYSGRGC